MECRQANGDRRGQQGVTLVELMIAVGIVGILAAVAYPSYRNQVMRTTRTEARTALEQRALQLEKCFTRYMSYNNANCAAGQAAANSSTAHYSITISNPGGNATSFTLTATPQGAQAADTQCATLTIRDTGQRGPAGCW